jgi:transglutaminase-like putative cysteine protease
MTHTVAPPALDRDSRAPGLASVTSATDLVPAPDARDEPLGLDLAATIGMIAYAITVAIGFSRVFIGWDFLEDLIIIAVVGHGVSYVTRRLRFPPFVAIPLVLVVLTWLVAWIYYPDTFSGVFPLADTWEAVRADFRLVRDDFQSTTPPVDYAAGWAFLAGATMAATVWLADTFAFRAQARGEALVPGAVLFVFVAALGVDERRMVTSLAVIGAGYCALALLRQRLERRPRTVLGRSIHPLATTVPAIACAGIVVIGGAWALGPNLPGAEAEPLFDTRNDRGGVTEIVSPLVDIRSRLVNQAENELFTVRADLPSYWRAAALPEFDGDQWTLPETILDDVDGQLNAAAPGAVRNQQLTTILGLEGALVPAAAEPVLAEGPGLGFNSLTYTLVKTTSELDRGDTYSIDSQMPRFSPDALRATSTGSPPDPVFLQLPDDLPQVVGDTAREVTAVETTPFDQMVALQDWFRTEFTYSTDIPDGHGNSAIETFLEDRVGYCEQFAGTFAAMARSLDIPTRVAVGFTQGQVQDDGTYLVLGRNAHAWPEVWFDGYGWVPFEPTPGRGMPGAEAYTGVLPQQAGDPPPPTTTTTTTAPAPTTTVAGQGQVPPPPPAATTTTTTLPPNQQAPASQSAEEGSSFPWLIVLGVVAVVVLLIALPEIVRRWRRRRRAPITDPAYALLELWDRALRALAAIGFRSDPALTPIEVSGRAAAAFPAVGDPLQSLAVVATAASYAPTDDVVELADADRHGHGYDGPHGWCALVEGTVEDSLSLPERIKRYFTVWH